MLNARARGDGFPTNQKERWMEYRAFEYPHLAGVMRLAAREGWPSLSTNADRSRRALTAPGVWTIVAVADGAVVGFAHALTDGETTTYLSVIAVDAAYRGQQIGRRLIDEVFQRCGVARIDLLAEEAAEGFYQTLPHHTKPAYRLYPSA